MILKNGIKVIIFFNITFSTPYFLSERHDPGQTIGSGIVRYYDAYSNLGRNNRTIALSVYICMVKNFCSGQ